MAPNESVNTVRYTLTFTGAWTAASHPLDYPAGGVLSGPHFSGLIGATHDSAYAIIRENQPPSPGLERLSEEGKHSPLDDEIRAAIKSGRAGTLIETDGVDPDGRVRVTFEIDENHPLLSVVAMIAPSPDWFMGFKDVVLWDGNAWTPRRAFDVFAWDSGGDEGTTYKADDLDNAPKKPTVENQHPHFLRDGAPVKVGSVVIELL